MHCRSNRNNTQAYTHGHTQKRNFQIRVYNNVVHFHFIPFNSILCALCYAQRFTIWNCIKTHFYHIHKLSWVQYRELRHNNSEQQQQHHSESLRNFIALSFSVKESSGFCLSHSLFSYTINFSFSFSFRLFVCVYHFWLRIYIFCLVCFGYMWHDRFPFIHALWEKNRCMFHARLFKYSKWS